MLTYCIYIAGVFGMDSRLPLSSTVILKKPFLLFYKEVELRSHCSYSSGVIWVHVYCLPVNLH